MDEGEELRKRDYLTVTDILEAYPKSPGKKSI